MPLLLGHPGQAAERGGEVCQVHEAGPKDGKRINGGPLHVGRRGEGRVVCRRADDIRPYAREVYHLFGRKERVNFVDNLKKTIEAIEQQQPKERTPVWMVGEQLKDMLREEPHLAELVVQDLEQKGMSLAECEKKIKAFADKGKSGGFSCVIPAEAERIIREFYGLPERGTTPEQKTPSGKVLDLADFL